MRMYDIIAKKRDGFGLTKEEIDFFIEGYTRGDIPDYQASALSMAIFIKGMDDEETANLTMAMAKSGDVLDLHRIEGVKVDKHSTGGVGDKTSLVLGPMVAALGVPVAKMSGRGLGHTGGTIDKLESFPGFVTGISEETFINNVNSIKIAIAGQTGNLAPADKKLYALRDVTATVNCIPLIASSIMSKKIASGADVIVLDVKTGSGAFMKKEEDAIALAETMVRIGTNVGRRTIAIVSDMDEPLGNAVGNSIEVIEAVNTLKGNGPEDLLKLCICLGSYMVVGGKITDSVAEAEKMLVKTIEDGSALNKLKQLVSAQGSDSYYAENPEQLLKAEFEYEVKAEHSGYVSRIICDEVGTCAMLLGGGRETKESTIDLGAGIYLKKKVGDYVEKGEGIAVLYTNDKEKLSLALNRFHNVYAFSDEKPCDKKLIKYIITKEKIRKFD